MEKWISYFIDRPLISNTLTFGILFASLLIWSQMSKEEMPEFAMKSVRVHIKYPGASAEDVELFIAKPIEEKLKGISGLYEIENNSSYGNSSTQIYFEPQITNLQEKIQEVKDAINAISFPREVDDPVFRQFKNSEKAIIDIGIYLKDVEILNTKNRLLLQSYALGIKNKLLSLPEVSGVESSGYLRPELQIKVKPEQLERYELTLSQVKDQIQAQNIRQPIGSLNDEKETEIVLNSELNSVESLNDVNISSGFQGQKIKLHQVASIENGFEKHNSIIKIQGNEGIIFNIQKSSAVDILSAQEAIVNFMKDFKKDNIAAPVDFVFIDDESYDVKNRLYLVSSNGIIGFLLIAMVLLFFLDFRSSIWVAVGIPFSLAFTLIATYTIGFTINNVTLAAIIIVLGIVVDDAIIIAENMSRYIKLKPNESLIKSVSEVGKPVLASVLTTCAAFIPLYFFSGRLGMFIKYIPTVIFLMLLASLIESFFILPAHMKYPTRFENFLKRKFKKSNFLEFKKNFLLYLEDLYRKFLAVVLTHRLIVLFSFFLLLGTAIYLLLFQLDYVMFPREEARYFRLKVVAAPETTRVEMAKKIRTIEDVFLNDPDQIVQSTSSSIGLNRRGNEAKENEASIRVEISPPSERNISLNKIIEKWKLKTDAISGFEEIKFQKSRFGQSHQSPIAIEIQENNDTLREQITTTLVQKLAATNLLKNIEVEKPITKPEYNLVLNKDEVSRLNIKYSQLSATLRDYVEGDILYTINNGEEEIDIRFTSADSNKKDITSLTRLTVANLENYLVPIKNLVSVVEKRKPTTIRRINYKRTTRVYADIEDEEANTPLDIAAKVEESVFPTVLKGKPSSNLTFRGEIEDSRESQKDFVLSIVLALGIIYVILILLFNSLWTPLLVGSIIPFGVTGTVFAFWSHGIPHYGFFAVIGTLGMLGVVINDAIVLIAKLEDSISYEKNLIPQIISLSSSRLRAILITTFTTVAGLLPTAYGLTGYDAMLAQMMFAMAWGLLFGMFITLILVPCIYSFYSDFKVYKNNV